MPHRLIPVVVAIVVVVASAPAQDVIDGFAAQTVRYTGGPYDDEAFGYRLYVPKPLDPGRRYPLIFFLHGAGERGDDNQKQMRHFPELFKRRAYREKFEAIIVAPQCRVKKRWADVPWDTQQSSKLTKNPSHQMRAALLALDEVIAKHPVDEDRLYLTGLSMGGYGSWYLATRQPKRWAAVVPICGGGPEADAARLAGVPLWAWHGGADRVVPVERSRRMIEVIKRAGGAPKYTELKGVGHFSWPQAYAIDGALPWMFEQRRGRERRVARKRVLPVIDVSKSPNGVVPMPERGVPRTVRRNFQRYTKLVAPNRKSIHILVQDGVSDEQAVRAREVMRFYLTNAPGTRFGADKTKVANAMADREATLLFFKSEREAAAVFLGPMGKLDLPMQDLYATECVVEGSRDYLQNRGRDATLEEVFHLVHDQGIIPALPGYQEQLLAATKNAMEKSLWIAKKEWIREGCTTHEYIISVIDVRYGMWAHDRREDGWAFHGEYRFNTPIRLRAGDPKGLAAMKMYLPESLDFEVRIDASFDGEFTLSHDPGRAWTQKSRHLTHATLTGDEPSGLTGNDRANRLTGNRSDNVLSGLGGDDDLRGGAGADVAVYRGAKSDYRIRRDGATVVVEDTKQERDGADRLHDIERLRFIDGTVKPPQ